MNAKSYQYEPFTVGSFELIRFPKNAVGVPVVFRNLVFESEFGADNHFAKSRIFERLQKEILPEMERIWGSENILPFTTDLTAVCGEKKHGFMQSRIGIPTFDFVRANCLTFRRYPVDYPWWLATPWQTYCETASRANDVNVACVAPGRGGIFKEQCDTEYGVRPFLILKKSVFEDVKEEEV